MWLVATYPYFRVRYASERSQAERRLAAMTQNRIRHEDGAAFDAKYSVDTAAPLLLHDSVSVPQTAAFGTDYWGVSEEAFHFAMEKVDVSPSEYTFIDLGSGKAKSLILAHLAGFQKLVGVEFAPELHRIAVKNEERFRQVYASASFSLVCADAGEYQLPAGPLLIFMFNPFNEVIMARVVDNLRRALEQEQRPAIILYLRPLASRPLDDCSFLTRIFMEPPRPTSIWHVDPRIEHMGLAIYTAKVQGQPASMTVPGEPA